VARPARTIWERPAAMQRVGEGDLDNLDR
jgi:hypothetical protein